RHRLTLPTKKWNIKISRLSDMESVTTTTNTDRLTCPPPAEHRVGWRFIALYALAFMSTSLVFLAPTLVTLPLKINALVGFEDAPARLALVAGIGALVAMVGNPF